jgi:hypothetical protein
MMADFLGSPENLTTLRLRCIASLLPLYLIFYVEWSTFELVVRYGLEVLIATAFIAVRVLIASGALPPPERNGFRLGGGILWLSMCGGIMALVIGLPPMLVPLVPETEKPDALVEAILPVLRDPAILPAVGG